MLVDDKEEKDLAVGFGMSLEVILFCFRAVPWRSDAPCQIYTTHGLPYRHVESILFVQVIRRDHSLGSPSDAISSRQIA